MQRWRALGHVFVAAGESDWLASHASYPTPFALPDGTLRIFFSPRDRRGRSSIFSLDLALRPDGFERLGPPIGPWLEPGPDGAFDDAGASVACVLPREDGGIEAWYLGWTQGSGALPFRTAIGCAVAGPGETRLHRPSYAPALDRDATDPLSLGYPWLRREGATLTAWYGTHRCPPTGGRAVDHPIRRAVSRDGAAWVRDAEVCLDHAEAEEWALSRPSVLRDEAGWHLWYCRRHAVYRLGYAFSADGVTWRRDDEAIRFVTPPAPWENEARTYPAVFDHAGRRWMLHNGNGYGRSGFGLALLES